MVWNFYYSYGEEPIADRNSEGYSGNAYGSHVDPQTFKPFRNRSNNWMIDRRMQKYETFTGIDGINQQDRAVQESMGPIVDRTRENLGPGDRAVVVTRKLLLEAIDSVQRGEVPRGVSPSYYEVRAAEAVLPKSENWRTKLLLRMHPESRGLPADQIQPEPTVLEDAAAP